MKERKKERKKRKGKIGLYPNSSLGLMVIECRSKRSRGEKKGCRPIGRSEKQGPRSRRGVSAPKGFSAPKGLKVKMMQNTYFFNSYYF